MSIQENDEANKQAVANGVNALAAALADRGLKVDGTHIKLAYSPGLPWGTLALRTQHGVVTVRFGP